MALFAYAYAATGIVFLVLDGIWLSIMGRLLYKPQLGGMLQEPFNVAPAALFYLIYIAGIVFFAVQPALASGRWSTALIHGALLGFVAYATYDLTNQATLKNWPVLITVADLIWGTIVTGAAATLGFLLAKTIAGALAR